MTVNFIECDMLNWVLIREEMKKNGSFKGTTYHSPHVILGTSHILHDISVDLGGAEKKSYMAGIYRTKNNEKW